MPCSTISSTTIPSNSGLIGIAISLGTADYEHAVLVKCWHTTRYRRSVFVLLHINSGVRTWVIYNILIFSDMQNHRVRTPKTDFRSEEFLPRCISGAFLPARCLPGFPRYGPCAGTACTVSTVRYRLRWTVAMRLTSAVYGNID